MEKPTAEELKNNLEQIVAQVARNQNIENFKINLNTEPSKGDGMSGQFYDEDILNKDTGETTNITIKKPPEREFLYQPLFNNEYVFYQTSFPALDDLQKEKTVSTPFDNIPKYFCGDLEIKKEYIAMENLKPLGYLMVDKTQYLDKEHLEIIFKTYGKFHALSYVLRKKDLEKYQIITEKFINVGEMVAKVADKLMAAAISAAVNALDPEKDKTVLDEIQDFGQYTVENFIDSYNYKGEHRCIIHGDCWSNNFLFKYSESGTLLDMKLLDFQQCQDNTPIQDLSYFFYSGASKKDFDNLDNYLQIYYKSFSEFAKELGANLDEIFSFDVLKNEWKENAVFGVLAGIYLWQLKLIPKEYIANMSGQNDGKENMSMEEMFKHWAVLLGELHSTDLYRERTTAILRHAVEYGVLNKNKIKINK